ncbi:MAG: YibE/F family protein [Anaerocolumna sp.]
MKQVNRGINILINVVIILLIIAITWGLLNQKIGYKRYETSTRTYNKAEVLKINTQELDVDDTGEYITGYQDITVKFTGGKEKGKETQIQNTVTATHNVIAKPGQTLIICSDVPENAESYYTVYNYYRAPVIWFIVLVFLGIIAVIGGKKGVKSGISLLFTFFVILCYLLPALYRGDSPLFATVITAALSTAVTLYYLNGLTYKTLIGILSTTMGIIIAGILFFVISELLTISGYQTDEAESLILISQSTGLQIKGILFAGVLIASLGAVMDVAVSIGSSLYEIISLNPDITGRELFKSGMNIGKDMIGTMTNTLILAYAGSSLMTLLIFISYGLQYQQLLSSDYLAIELGQAIAGSAAVVITVPVASAFCSLGYPHFNKITRHHIGGKS